MLSGDVPVMYAYMNALEQNFGFRPESDLRTRLRKFVVCYKGYYE